VTGIWLQVDYEATKHELSHVREELSEMTSEVEATERLKSIAEQNLSEALNMLAQERELRHSIKKDLDQRITSESMFGLHNLSLLGLGDTHQTPSGSGVTASNSELGLYVHHLDDGDVHNPALKRIEADFSSPKHELLRPAPSPPQGLVGDLFSEVHVGEMRKLERMLEQTEIEKSNLERALKESSCRLAEAVAEAAARSADVTTLKAQLEQVSSSTNKKTSLSEIPGADPIIVAKFPDYESAVLELSVLTNEFEALHHSNIEQQPQPTVACTNGQEQPDVESVVYYKDLVNKLEVQFADQCQVAEELSMGFSQTKAGLQQICVNFAQLYSSICEQAGEAPSKALVGSVTEDSSQASIQSIRRDDSTAQNATDNFVSTSENGTGNNDHDTTVDCPPAVACYKLIEVAQKQIQYVGCVFERLVEKSRGPYHANVTANMDEVTELQEQVWRACWLFSLKYVIKPKFRYVDFHPGHKS